MKLIENMDYSNFIKRIFISILFLTIYFIISLYNFSYLYFLVIFIYFITISEILFFFKKLRLTITVYLFISFINFLNYNFNFENYIKFNLLITIIVSFDIFSYMFGKLLGKNKLIGWISPNKTIEGFAGGFVMSFLLAYIFMSLFNIDISIFALFFIFIMIISSLIGDLLESYFKRKNNLKNSSSFLPGHGGFFDRFDSFLFSIIPFVYLSEFL